eukprot:TRINITY_DN10431_c0_g1_i1.p3 TRINITY_DN10431_c0_g1~~TRINITY_DN10431_c0_g1_i1.p3  ORF type:complete len:202 (-),score=53.50 TRINITY_DN10431_c0_g1_i1:1591-2196(-)
MEQLLQRSIIKCSDLLVLSELEPRLQGRFPIEQYKSLIASAQLILDRSLSTRLALSEGLGQEVLNHMLLPLGPMHLELLKKVTVYLYMINGALRSREPLPYYMPSPAKHLAKISAAVAHLPGLTEGRMKSLKVMSYYAAGLAIKSISQEIENIGNVVKQLYGEDDSSKGIFPNTLSLSSPASVEETMMLLMSGGRPKTSDE